MSEEHKIEVKRISVVRGERIPVISGRKNVIVVSRSPCYLLEMEDVLFHHDSVVMMPENPEGMSSRDGSKDKGELKVSGLRSLSLVFREIEISPLRKILICGHTDRSGGVE
ncbi:MAG: hypothetical protein N2053_03305, partial [Chitinispirillaceae bacterium]|nr:hypothetical protein [Chitinispirillaceae bacterium]